jgi:small subunit ribosomal protein S9
MAEAKIQATGRRKTSIARVLLSPGSGKMTVNKKSMEQYFPRDVWRFIAKQPLQTTETADSVDIQLNIQGGGLSGQADAARLGIARALCEMNPEFRGPLKKAGLLTRDDREVERKKYGLAGARRRYQYSKR